MKREEHLINKHVNANITFKKKVISKHLSFNQNFDLLNKI